MQKRSKKKLRAKEIFDKFMSKTLVGSDSGETIETFSNFNYNSFYDFAKKYKLRERQISSLVGFKDEFFVYTLVSQIIIENKLNKKFYCKKVTANRTSGLKARKILNKKGEDKLLTVGGDCVIFHKENEKPLMIIECKEYIDMIRMKELIGESRIIKDEIKNSINLLKGIKFCAFAEVLELTEEWSLFLKKSDLKYKLDKIFVVREGKRKDKTMKPSKSKLYRFKKYIENFLKDFK